MKTIFDLVITKAFAADPLGSAFEKIVTGKVSVGIGPQLKPSATGAKEFWTLLPDIIKSIADWLLGLIAILCVFMIIVGGYQYLLGAIEGKGEGKQTVIYALSGLVISLLAYVIVATVLGVLGADLTNI